MSVHESDSRPREGAASTIAGFLAALAIFAGAAALVYYPGRVGSAAVLVALIAAGIGGFQRGLAAFAVAFTGICWFAGMIIAISLERPIF
jgi:hypothetical protein